MNFTHNKVNHLKVFKSKDGIHTNHIEGIFGACKRLMRHYSTKFAKVYKLNRFLGEWMFRYCYDGWDRRKMLQKLIYILKEKFE
jgi:hypothetical protein